MNSKCYLLLTIRSTLLTFYPKSPLMQQKSPFLSKIVHDSPFASIEGRSVKTVGYPQEQKVRFHHLLPVYPKKYLEEDLRGRNRFFEQGLARFYYVKARMNGCNCLYGALITSRNTTTRACSSGNLRTPRANRQTSCLCLLDGASEPLVGIH